MRLKKFSIVLSAVLLSGLFLVLPVWAGTGSITITSNNTESIAFARVADIVDGKFKICSQFQSAEVNLNALESAEQLNEAAEKLSKLEIESEIYNVENEKIKIENLPSGVYLIFDSDDTDNRDMMPSLIQIPMQEEENGEMLYEIEVYPKYVQLSETNVPQTGDGSDVVLYTALVLGSLLILLLLGFVFLLPILGQ